MKFINNDAYDLEGIESFYNDLTDRTKQYFSELVIKKMSNLLDLVNECESPIEELMAMALSEQEHVWNYIADDCFFNIQETLKIGENKYRVDFFIVIRKNNKHYGFVVECDGHDFHEKTKEQAKKDKKRERELLAAGYIVIRFTGSEIFANPSLCAREVTKLISNRLSEA